jgi:regulatory protein
VKALAKPRRVPAPLDQHALQELALRYVGKYATTRAKLSAYLSRKLRERGWNGGPGPGPDLAALAERFAELGYIDDAAYAMAKSRTLAARGYGKRRLSDKLRLAGIGEDDSIAAKAHADREAINAALRFAQRRRLGPFAVEAAERPQREKWISAMVRAGHGFALARAIAMLPQGADIDVDQLRESARLTDV